MYWKKMKDGSVHIKSQIRLKNKWNYVNCIYDWIINVKFYFESHMTLSWFLVCFTFVTVLLMSNFHKSVPQLIEYEICFWKFVYQIFHTLHTTMQKMPLAEHTSLWVFNLWHFNFINQFVHSWFSFYYLLGICKISERKNVCLVIV